MRITLDIDMHDDSVVVTWPDHSEEELDRDQQRALFAGFSNVFGHTDVDARHLFTRVLLDKGPDEHVSWTSLTKSEASTLLTALDACERVMAFA